MKFLCHISVAALLVAASVGAPAHALSLRDEIVLVSGGALGSFPTSALASSPYTIAGSTIQSGFIGIGAGGAFPIGADSGYSSWGVGAEALASLTTTNAEDAAFAAWALQHCTSCTISTALGMHAGGSEVSAPGLTLTGDDAMRDAISYNEDGYVTATGQGAAAHGNPDSGTVDGANALTGNSGAVILGGTPTNGDVLHVTLSASAGTPGTVTGLPVTATHTVASGDTFTSIASALASQFANVVDGPSYILQAFSTGQPDGTGVVSFRFPGSTINGWQISISSGCVGTCGETLTNVAGDHPTNYFVGGNGTLYGWALGAINDAAIVDPKGFQYQYGSTGELAVLGASTGEDCTNCRYWAVTGTNALNAATTAAQISGEGYGILASLTTGSDIVANGTQVLPSLTTGALINASGWKVGGTCATASEVLLLGTDNNTQCGSAGENGVIHIGAGATDVIYSTGTTTPGTSLTNIAGNFYTGSASALGTSATGPFPYAPTMAGPPTGTPAQAQAGQSAFAVDSTDHKLCWYEQANSVWECAASAQAFAGGTNSISTTAGTTYGSTSGVVVNNSEANLMEAVPRNGTFGAVGGNGLYASVTVAPGSGNTITFTLRVNGATPSNGPTCTISGASAMTCSDTTHTASISAGQTHDIQIVTAGTSIASARASWGIGFQ